MIFFDDFGFYFKYIMYQSGKLVDYNLKKILRFEV